MAATTRQCSDHAVAAGLLPQPFAQQRRADAPYRDGGGIAGSGSVEHHRLLDETRTRAQQPIELSAGFEFIEASQRGDDALPHLITRSVALHDLQVDAPLRLLAAEIHVRLVWCAQIDACTGSVNQKHHHRVALHIQPIHRSASVNSITYDSSEQRYC